MDHDPHAFEILVRQHHRRLMAYAISILKSEAAAEDVVQESFLAAWENLERFEPGRNFAAWMRGIVRNKCREHARGNRLVAVDDEFLEVLESRHDLWDRQASDLDSEHDHPVFEALSRCISKLPDLLSQSVSLFYLQRLGGQEAAHRAGADEPAFRKRLQRARVQLGQCIERTLA